MKRIIVQHMVRSEMTGNVEGYNDIAFVRADIDDVNAALEYAYRWTNNIEGSWSRRDIPNNSDANPNVVCLEDREDGLGQRSTSIFDRMLLDGKTYEVRMSGFKEIA